MLYVFYGKLQFDVTSRLDATLTEKMLAQINTNGENNRKVLETKNQESSFISVTPKEFKELTEHGTSLGKKSRKMIVKDKILEENTKGTKSTTASEVVDKSDKKNDAKKSIVFEAPKPHKYDDTCFTPADVSSRKFVPLEPDSYVYSAYLDERNPQIKPIVRVMTLLSLDKKNRVLNFYCHFKVMGRDLKERASVYELCENHAKKYGGFILSCSVPIGVFNVCNINISMEINPVHYHYIPPKTSMVTVPVTRILSPAIPITKIIPGKSRNSNPGPKYTTEISTVPFNFSVCVPPLFGKFDTIKFIEFIELNRILGIQHFIFYLSTIANEDVIKILEYYKKLNIVTVVDWLLPSVVQKNKVWYNGQLNAHNDCVYRSMSISQHTAIIDIDEFLVPHNGALTITEAISGAFTGNVAGLSFNSAFYDPNFSKGGLKSKLLTISRSGRSAVFSKVRTKVMVQPTKIFEVGIHHISKPFSEEHKVLKVNTSVAFLHHYRTCVPNYGMKCGNFEEDETVLTYQKQLEENVKAVFKEGLDLDIKL